MKERQTVSLLEQVFRGEPDLSKKVDCFSHPLSCQKARQLKKEGREEELICYCLPTFFRVVDNPLYWSFRVAEDELWAAGYHALVEGVSGWDPEKREKGGKPYYLKTHVFLKVRRALESHISQAYGLRGADFGVVCLYEKCYQDFCEENGRAPNLAEITSLAKSRNNKNDGLELYFKKPGKKGEASKIAVIYQATEAFFFGRLTGGEVSLEEEVEKRALEKELSLVLQEIEPRRAEVLYRLICLGETLEKVADDFGVTEERIRQIKQRGLQLLRQPARSCRLRDFL